MAEPCQLISYIAPAAPATRRPASGNESFLRPEFGFTPLWYHTALGIDFGARWHLDPAYRAHAIERMRAELATRFPNTSLDRSDEPTDLLTGLFGACTVAGIYGLSIIYRKDQWPVAEAQYLSDEDLAALEPPDLATNAFFNGLIAQGDWIAQREGVVTGYINWQGVLNNAHRLRGEQLFTDMLVDPESCMRLFDCVCTTMIDAAKKLHESQRATGFDVHFFTASNCLVNLVSPELYRDLLLPFDIRLAESFESMGIHNCAWTVDPYLDLYARVPNCAYIDMGLESDLARAKNLFPHARRAVMYRPTELAEKYLDELRDDLERIARELGPCDLVCADVEDGTPDQRILEVVALCDDISNRAAQEVAL